ncbi:pyrroline-5-carboxylate reductase [Deltaproteobacteria bacterium TL4]
MKIALIGGGTMGSSMARAFIQKKRTTSESLLIVEVDSSKRDILASELKCHIQESLSSNLAAYETLVLAVKPQNSVETLKALSTQLKPQQLVLSIMAGVSIETLMKHLKHQSVVRVMPNTPAQIGQGLSVFYASPSVTQDQRERTRHLLSACGLCLEVVSEDAIDGATAISGSGPAYLFYVAEQMITAARALNFSQSDAQQMVLQTIKGATLLWEHKALTPEELRHQVTSPGGTTEAAVRYFELNQLGTHLQKGIQCAYQRAKELA